MTSPNDFLCARILGAFSDFPLCAPAPLAEFTERARQLLDAPMAAVWRADNSHGRLLLEQTWEISAAEALALWEDIETSLTLDTPSILDLDESPWRYRSPLAKRIKSLLYLPVWTSQRFLGVVLLARGLDHEAFTREELQGLRLPLQAVAFALEHERLSAKAEVMTQRLERLVNAIPVPVFFFDANLNVTQPNPAFKTLLGLPGDFSGGDILEIWGRTKHRLADPEAVKARLLEILAKPEEASNVEVTFSGEGELHYRFVGVPFLDAQGQYGGGATIAFDITPDRRLLGLQQEYINTLDLKVQERTEQLLRAIAQLEAANEELLRVNAELSRKNEDLAKANQYKDDFMSNVSHELRTPLYQVIGYASLLADGVAGSLTPEQEEFVTQIAQGSDQVLKLVNGILDLTRIDAGKFTLHPTWIDYRELLAATLRNAHPQVVAKELAVQLEVADDVTSLWVSPEEMQQVLSNLIHNAIKFTPAGGRLMVRAYRDAEGVVTEVQDTGIGIAPEEHDRIFERFVQVDSSSTRPYQGSGLGLAIVKQLVELHGGRVSVDSEPGRGSCFRVWLGQPASSGEVTPARQGSTDSAERRG